MPAQPNQITDAELIRRVRRGDRIAADTLTARHRQSTLRLAFQTLRNADDAQDVAQESLLYALLHIADLREPDKFAPWLRSVTLTRCMEYRRRKGTRPLGPPLHLMTERGEETAFTESLMIREAIAHLPPAHRATFLLHYVGGHSLTETAALQGVPVNTIRSRLMRAKHLVRDDLAALFPTAALAPDAARPKGVFMSEVSVSLTPAQARLLSRVFPHADLLHVTENPEAWMPFSPQVTLVHENQNHSVVFRTDLSGDAAALFEILEAHQIPCPRILAQVQAGRETLTLCDAPRGENLSFWTLGGTPHRIHLAAERVFAMIECLHQATEAVLAAPVGANLPRRTLLDEANKIADESAWQADGWLSSGDGDSKKWLSDDWFARTFAVAQKAAAHCTDPLVLTNYLHYFPNFYRIMPDTRSLNEPMGWPGDDRTARNTVAEVTVPQGHIGDPFLGLAMVWVMDCYPFVQTGFVEQFLFRRNQSKKDFAPRLLIAALQMIARDLPVGKPENSTYWDALHGWAEQALEWM